MTQYALRTVQGASKYLQEELHDFGILAEIKGSDWCSAELTSDQLQSVRLRSQLANRVLELIAVTTKEAIHDIAESVTPKGSFCVRASGPDRQELEASIGEAIYNRTKAPVNLTKPDELYYCHETDGQCVFGKDCFGDLGKRHYKIMTGSQSLAGPVAAAILRASGWKPDKDLLVWPCTTGELAIEAALWASTKSPRAYELKVLTEKQPACKIIAADNRLSMVRSVEKNAKVAGIHQHIRFSRQDLDWLDTKHDEYTISNLIGVLPNLKLYPKFSNELFYQLDYILAKDGVATFVCVNEDSAVVLEHKPNYACSRTYIWAGKHPLIIVFIRPENKKTPSNNT